MPRSTTLLAAAAALADHTGEPLYRAFNRNTLAALAADARPVFGNDDERPAPPDDETESERTERLRRLASATHASRIAARKRNAPNN